MNVDAEADLRLRPLSEGGTHGQSHGLSWRWSSRSPLPSSPRRPSRAGRRGGPFKLGTFEQGGRTFLGLVLRDAQIVDIARANAAYERPTRRRRS
jgi:hypothetical protein